MKLQKFQPLFVALSAATINLRAGKADKPAQPDGKKKITKSEK